MLSWSELAERAGCLGCSVKKGCKIGPIPKGTPVNLLTNIDFESSKLDLAKLLLKMKADLKAVEGKSEQEAAEVFKNLVPDLLQVSKCPDFVVNKGHYFGTSFAEGRDAAERRRQTRVDRILENVLIRNIHRSMSEERVCGCQQWASVLRPPAKFKW